MSRLLDIAAKTAARRGRNFYLSSARASVGAGLQPGKRGSVASEALDAYQEGQVIHGFAVDRVSTVDELRLTAVNLTHEATAARYIHLHRDDDNNVFSVGFRTTPSDSTGLPHILEHTVLCGSEKFPCRDPFFKMLRRSLATFMNAMTGPDYTIYPFSTQNLKDFQNLRSVYLDATLKPNLKLLDFRQEGWRLEHADANDKSSPVVIKGVVFNEMKGAFAENQTIFAERMLNSILPSHTYGVISGGDPLVIPQLTHSNLVNFHSKYYHPSNARFFSYGNFPLEDHLGYLNEHYLSHATRIDASGSAVPAEPRWISPRREHVSCKPDPMAADPDRQSSIAIGFLCSDVTDVQETFEMHILSRLLLQGPTSAFYRSLIEPNIGAGFSPVTGYDAHTRDTTFVVGLQGVSSEDFGRVESIVDETIDRVLAEGFEDSHVEAVIHSIELGVKHQSSNFGLSLLFNLTPLWNHEGDVVSAMRVNRALSRLRESLKNNPRHLCDLTAKYLKNNSHRLTLTMSPEDSYEQRIQAEENALLAAKLKNLTPQDLEQIYEQGQQLLAEQGKKDDAAILPSLKIDDVEDETRRVPVDNRKISSIPLQVAVRPTNGVTYYRGILNVADLPPHLKELVPLFNAVVNRMGTANYDYRSFDRMVQLKTGGLSLSNHVCEAKDDVLAYEEGILVSSHCLDRNLADMWKLWSELFNGADLTDLKRFETLIKMTAANLANGIADAGHLYAAGSSAALVSPIAGKKESISGLEFVERMKKLAGMKDLSSVLGQMREIADTVLRRGAHLRSAVNLSPESENLVLREIEHFYGSLKDDGNSVSGQTSKTANPSGDRVDGVHYVLPLPVNYAAKSILTVPYTDPRHAALRVLSKLVTSVYLHPEVREKGGAYGGGAKLSGDGVFSFYSYRDPNSTRTMDTFDGTYDFLCKNPATSAEIDEAKLGVFQQIDSPVAPGNQGMTKFIHKLTDEEKQRHRQQLKNVTREQLMEVADEYLKPGALNVRVGRSLIGNVNPEITSRPEKWVVRHQDEPRD